MSESKTAPELVSFDRANSPEELYLMPREGNAPYYPGNRPMVASKWRLPAEPGADHTISIKSFVIQYWDYLDGGARPADHVLEVLRQWFIYYAGAPCWSYAQEPSFMEFKEILFRIDSWESLELAKQAAFTVYFLEPF